MMHIKNMRFIGITGGVGAGKSAILSYLAKKPKTKVMLADEIAHKLMEPGTDCYRQIVKQFAGEDIFEVTVQTAELLHAKIHQNRLQRWDFCTPESLSHGLRSKCADLSERLLFEEQLSAEGAVSSETSFPESIVSDDKPTVGSIENRAFDRNKLAQVIFSNPKKREEMNAIVHPAVKEYVRQQYRQELRNGQLDLLVLEAALLIEEKYDEICDELWYIYTSEENRRKRLVESRGYSQEKIDSIFKSQLSEQEFRKFTQITIDNNGDLRETYKQIENALRRKADELCIWS